MAVPLVEKGYSSTTQNWWGVSADDEETPELRWPFSIEVYDRMRRSDAQVMSVLRAVTLPIRRTTWRVDPDGCKPEVAQFVAEELGLPVVGQAVRKRPLRSRDRFSWDEHLRLALTMLPFGHSYFEQVYRPDLTNGRYHLRKLGWRPPRTIARFDVAADGGLNAIQQYATLGVAQGQMITIPVSRLVAYVNDREGGNWRGQSLLRPAYKFWLLKDPSLRTWALTLERNGTGVPLYEGAPVPEGLESAEEIKAWQQDDLKAGLALATSYRGGRNAGGAVPYGATLALKGVKGTLADPEAFVRYCDESIAGAVLADFLKLGGENSTGSYALGQTFVDFFVMSLQSIGIAVRDVATQHIVEDLVDVNFGEDEPAPQLVFDEVGSSHPATAEAIAALITCGALTPDGPLEQHLRTTYLLPAEDPKTARRPADLHLPQEVPA